MSDIVVLSVVPYTLTATSGTTVRARLVLDIILKRYNVLLLSWRNLSGNDSNNNRSCYDGRVLHKELNGSALLRTLKVIPFVLQNSFRIVYCVHDPLSFLPFAVFSRIKGFRTIYEAHALIYKERLQVSLAQAILYLLLEFLVAKSANCIIALSGRTFNFFKRFNKNTVYIPVFVDSFKFVPKSGFGSSERKTIGLIGPFDNPLNSYQIEFVYKNLDLFDRRIQFRIIGACKNRISHERVTYSGYITNEFEYISELKNLDGLIVPVRIATYGPKTKILEAMMCGVPVFTTPQGIVGLDFVRPGQDLIVCNETELVSVVNSTIFNDNASLKLRENARRFAEKYFSQQRFERKLLDVISKELHVRD